MHLEGAYIRGRSNHSRKTGAALVGRQRSVGKTVINRRTARDKSDGLCLATVVLEQRQIVRIQLETGIHDAQLIACTVNPSVSNCRAYKVVASRIYRRSSTESCISKDIRTCGRGV